MGIDFRRATINFDPTQGQEQSEAGAVVFGSNVRRADVAISAFDVGYTDDDHNIFKEKVSAVVENVIDRTVNVRVNYLFRDNSGNIDDRYNGTVDVLVIAEVE
jgi:hypothetical protein